VERPDPALYQPRLGWWQHGWRLALVLAISGGATVAAYQSLPPDHRVPWLVVDVAVGAAGLVLVHFRRRWPLPVAVLLALAGAVSAAASGPGILAGVSLATRRRWPEVLTVGATVVAGGLFYSAVVPVQDGGGPWWLDLTVSVLFTAAMLSAGMYVGSRRELLWALHQRAERAEAEQLMRAAQAKTTERSRIAREMHDVLAHRISQIAMQAGALSFREDLDAPALRAGVGEIQAQAHQALTDLRGVLGVLRDPDSGELVDAPQPTYADVPRLVADCRRAGLAVDLDDEVLGTLPEAVGRTVYRIVQEGLTNARKHAPGAQVRIRVSGTPADGVEVSVVNPIGFGSGSTPGAGLGLVGLTERAQLAGGRLETQRRESEFELRGWLPWAA
jgi:signal transduction histidine kinase